MVAGFVSFALGLAVLLFRRRLSEAEVLWYDSKFGTWIGPAARPLLVAATGVLFCLVGLYAVLR